MVEQILLRGEVVVEGALRDLGARRDLGDRGVGIAFGADDLGRGVDQLAPWSRCARSARRRRPALPSPPASRHFGNLLVEHRRPRLAGINSVDRAAARQQNANHGSLFIFLDSVAMSTADNSATFVPKRWRILPLTATDSTSPLDLLRTMRLIREAELRLAQLFADGEVPGFIHLSVGQEGVAAGVCAALGPDDTLASNHRGHGHALAKGLDLDRFFLEIMGKAEGMCQGRGGSMHVADAWRSACSAQTASSARACRSPSAVRWRIR